jgi:3-oxoacyl-[acyl-carrier protein] reductase
VNLGLAGKRVLVTGGTKGIGLATARIFAAESARVAITYHTAARRAADIVTELGSDRSLALPYDLADRDSISAAVESVTAAWGGVDILVANAQTWVWVNADQSTAFSDLNPDQWLPQFRENVEGHLLTAQRVLGGMRERGWGRMVFLSSVTAQHGNTDSEPYSTAKAALHGLVRSLMWTRHGVLSNVVAPGGTVTESLAAVDPQVLAEATAQTPSGQLSTADDVARLIVFLCSSANGNINGEVIHVAGGR